MYRGLIVDGNEFDVAVSVKRAAKLTPSDASGMLMNGDYFNDPIGMYMEYDVDAAVPNGKEYEYTALWNVLTDPVAEHQFIFPYNNRAIRVVAKVEEVKDSFYRTEDGVNIWKAISFKATATKPSKR